MTKKININKFLPTANINMLLITVASILVASMILNSDSLFFVIKTIEKAPVFIFVNFIIISSFLCYSIKKKRIGLTLLLLSLGVYTCYDPYFNIVGNELHQDFMFLRSEDFIKPSLLLTIALLSFIFGYFINIKVRSRTMESFIPSSHLPYLLASVIGLFATIIYSQAVGGYIARWSRVNTHFAGQGLAFGASTLFLAYPAYYYICNRKDKRKTLISSLLLFAYFLTALISGRSTQHIVLLIPFLIIYLKKKKLNFFRLILIAVSLIILLTTFRLARFIGEYFVEGNDITYIEIKKEFFGSELDPKNSFLQYLIFSTLVKLSDAKQNFLYGKTYLLIPTAFIPNMIWEQKQDFIDKYRVDRYLSYTLCGVSDERLALWPSGFYGEGYLNFGWFGVVLSGVFLGILSKISDILIDRGKYCFYLPDLYVGGVLTANLILFCRMSSLSFSIYFFMPIISLNFLSFIFYFLKRFSRTLN